MSKQYEAVIGLEIHLQVKTKSKMFSTAPAVTWQVDPNTNVTPVDLGLPGALPVPNKEAIRLTQRFGKALGCSLRNHSKFDRKNYFYPDLPKGYQISQYDEPFCENGSLDIVGDDGQTKKIRIRRIHLEEDTGKSMHKDGNTYLDYNKSGVPLAELVTEPDFASPQECSDFAKMIQEAAREIGISDADMEKGNFRLEANISVREVGDSELPNYRVELKNINSFKFMRDAVNYEITRQTKALEAGETLDQETRGWNESKQRTFVQRSKEEAHDYRYFPEPDIPPLEFDEAYFEEILTDLPVMPWDKEAGLIIDGVREDFAKVIAYTPDKYAKYEELKGKIDLQTSDLGKIIANTADVNQVEDIIKKSKEEKVKPGLPEDELKAIIEKVIEANPQAVADYKNGKETAVKYLLGQVMKESKGAAEPATATTVITHALTDTLL